MPLHDSFTGCVSVKFPNRLRTTLIARPLCLKTHTPMSNQTEQRSRRTRAIVNASISSFFLRVITVGTATISYGVASRSLNQKELDVWAAVSSIVSLLAFADLGVGAAVTTDVAFASGYDADESRWRSARSALTSTYFVACVAAAVGLCVWILIALWARTGGGPRSGYLNAALAVGLVTILSIPLGIPLRLLNGLQRAHAANGFSGLGTAISLGLVLLFSSSGSVVLLSVASVSSGAIAGVLAAAHLRYTGAPRISASLLSRASILSVLSSGRHYLVASIASAIAFGSDAIILARFGSTGDVAEYSAVYRISTFLPVMLFMFLQPVWPAITEALARGDYQWIRSSVKRAVRLTCAANLVGAIGLVFVERALVRAWLDGAVHVHTATVLSGAFLAIASSLWTVASMVMNGLGKIREQARLMMIMAAGNVVLSIGLVRLLGAAGPILGSGVALGIAGIELCRRLLRHLGGLPYDETVKCR